MPPNTTLIAGLPATFAWLVAIAACAPAFAADRTVAQPAWGSIDARQIGSGRFAARIERVPTDGRLVMPGGFPQIIRATAVGGAGSGERALVVELNADATEVAVLLPSEPDAADGTFIHLDTADETRQFDDGRIVYTARDAKVMGTKARLESHPGNHRIGFWSDQVDSVAWSRTGSRWGMYSVLLTYSTASPDGTEIEIGVNGATLPAALRSTGSWYRYTTITVGTVYLAAAGPQSVTVRCTKKVGGAVMNLKAVTLEPACEGTRPIQAADGTITLHGRDATVLGTTLRYEPAEKKQTLGFWGKAKDAAEWAFTVTTPGDFDVEVLQGCGSGQGGSTMIVSVDRDRTPPAAVLEFVVEETGHFQAFKPRVIGQVSLTAGPHTLHVQPTSIAKQAACDVRQVRLLPAVR